MSFYLLVVRLVLANDYETTIVGEREHSAASADTIRSRDLQLRPVRRPGDILQISPGLLVVQHAGGGKANQYFLRGFDADHGTDLAIFVDGVPVNAVSHGHGQGYADLNWLIPETVDRIEIAKGPYAAEHGDFATAGAINIVTKRSANESSVSFTGGMFQTERGTLVLSPKLSDGWRTIFAAEAYGTNGPFLNPERLYRLNGLARATRDFSQRTSLTIGVLGYGSGWNASNQIPLRAVRDGRLSRFGYVDPTDGGESLRFSTTAQLTVAPYADDSLRVLVFATHQRLALYSNFTFFAVDPVHGDQIEQRDVRTVIGGDASYRFVRTAAGITFATKAGLRLRADLIENELTPVQRRRAVGPPVVDTAFDEESIGLYAEETIGWLPWLRTIVGARLDWFHVGKGAAIVSPKASVVLRPVRTKAFGLDVYLNFGSGFHSNDARGVLQGVTPLSRALGYEAGLRTRLFERIDFAASFFGLDLESEVVWVGDEGTTEARGSTRRFGVELELRVQALPWLFFDADVAWTRAVWTANGAAVPLAPGLIASGGISVRHPIGAFGRVALVYVGERSANDDGSLRTAAFHRLDAAVGWRWRMLELSVNVQNVTNSDWREAQFANESRLPDEAEPREDLHFTPGAPINVQAQGVLHF